jgi:hypothetical protein
VARVIHFEITADKPERAVRFYEQALGWKIQSWGGPSPYWLVSTGADVELGIDGAIRDRAGAGQSTINTVSVPNLEAAVESVRAAGGAVVGEIQLTMPQDLMPDLGPRVV